MRMKCWKRWLSATRRAMFVTHSSSAPSGAEKTSVGVPLMHGALPAARIDAVDVVRAAERIATSAMRLLGARRARLVWRLEPDPAPMTGVTVPAEDTRRRHPAEAAAELAFGERALREGRALCTPDVLAERDLELDPTARDRDRARGPGRPGRRPGPGRRRGRREPGPGRP